LLFPVENGAFAKRSETLFTTRTLIEIRCELPPAESLSFLKTVQFEESFAVVFLQ
jgi:hypothetical protein